MATATYTGTQVAAFCYGRVDTLTNTARVVVRAPGTEVRLVITGTAATLAMTGSSTTPFTMTINGIAQSDPVISAGSMTLFTGQPDTTYTVSLSLKAANQGTGNYFASASTTLTVTGSTPLCVADTSYGPYLVARTGYKVWCTGLRDANNQATQQPEYNNNGAQYVQPLTSGGSQGNTVRVRGRADKVWALAQGSSMRYSLYKDNVFVSSTLDTAGIFHWLNLGTGLDDGNEHDWDVICGGKGVTVNAGGGGGGGGQYVDAVMLGGASAAISTTKLPTARTAFMAEGDSITASVDGGAGAGTSTGGDIGVNWCGDLARLTNKDVFAVGRPGKQWIDGAQQIPNDLQQCFSAGINPTHLVTLLGRNDTVQATVRTQCAAYIANALAVPAFTGRIVIVTVPEIYAFTGPTADGVNAGIRQGVADANRPDRVIIVEGAGWTDITANDGTHYDQAGHTIFANRVFAAGVMANNGYVIG